MLEEKYTEAIKNEIEKGRTFDEILNEIPTQNSTDQEMDAYFDAGEIAGVGSGNISGGSIGKVILLTSISLILVTSIIASPYILISLGLNLLFLFPIIILLGVPLSFFGKKQDKAITQLCTKRGIKIIEKYLTEDNYREKFDRRENSKILRFLKSILYFILKPIDMVSDLFIKISIILFPTK